ncbi:emp24p/erv25p- protein [Dimargaris cristalligena]|uniref:Membrane protein n=1 Tax=Dimargaris cristalligena TaxID=215637 RepID=A0A4P9ZLU4_9FUNG|nr:emp24p/erv25p- protein [Dimargaris cristalligena]RKP34105.1 membrane protein [Dimargaris cristalligena]|eukprot:RKP34105.1 membrane protein [Dimargaris cristalligena]
MRSLVLLPFLAGLTAVFVTPAQPLHFYLHNTERKCFLEELPKHTVVTGHFIAKEWIEQEKRLIDNPSIGIQVTAIELPSNHEIMNQKAANQGRFTFTSAIQGQHYVCLQGNSSNWFNPQTIQVEYDMTFGKTDADDKAAVKLDSLSGRVRELNTRTNALQLELEQQREREAEFRDLSETVNSHVVWYVVLQLVVLSLTCVWQVRYLKGFFEKKKLV